MTGRKIRVGVSGHDLKFWYPLQRMLEKTDRFEFKEDLWIGHEGHDPAESKALVDWADVLVAEWALGNAVYYAKHKRAGQKLIVRLHLQERSTSFPEEINYANVDRIVFVGAHIMRECIEKFPMSPERCEVIGNFVDTQSYGLSKLGDSAFVLGMIGTAPMRKRLDLAVDTLEVLLRRDSRYTLRVKGASPASFPWLWRKSDQAEYFENVYSKINSGPLRHKVIFDPHGADVHHWLRMVGFLLSPSDFESFHMAVAEGGAAASIPVLWNWEGVAEIYPEFEVVNNPEAAADFIEYFGRSAAGPRYRLQVQEAIRARYDATVIGERWEELLAGRASMIAAAKDARKGRFPLVVWAIDNWGTFHRREMLEALARNIADACDLIIIEPGNHFLAIEQMGWAGRSELTRIVGGELLQVSPNIFRTRLVNDGIPVGVIAAPQDRNDPLSVLDGLLGGHYGVGVEALHWVYKPDQARRLGDRRRFIYEIYDDYTFDFGTGEHIASVQQLEQSIMPKAEHVFFTSEPLQARKRRFARRSSLVGNGVTCSAFAHYRLAESSSRGQLRPVVGYLGNLSDFFDWELMSNVCQQLVDVDFVFHGQVEEAKLGERNTQLYRKLGDLANVRFTGRVARPLGAAAINRYDVLIIPFVENDAMDAVNPLKLWEYFATGRPVVSTPMTAIEEYGNLVAFASGVEEWLIAIREALSEEFQPHSEMRMAAAGRMDWSVLTQAHARVLSDIFSPEDAARNGVPAVDTGSTDVAH